MGKLVQVGPAGLAADLLLRDTPAATALAAVVRENAHLLGPPEPEDALAANLLSCLSPEDPRTADVRDRLADLVAAAADPRFVGLPRRGPTR